MKFEVTPEQEEKINEWYETLKPRIIAEGLKDPFGENEPYYGAIGGGLSYAFIPTGLGVCLTVKESITGETIDVTDFENW
jgi:hypothetical protein